MKNFAKVRYILLGMLIMSILSTTIITATASQGNRQLDAHYSDIKIVIDGETIIPKDATGKMVEPFIVDGTTYLPVRAMCEAIGYNVEWDGNTQTVYVYSDYDNSYEKP